LAVRAGQLLGEKHMEDTKISLLDLLDLPGLQGKIVRHLTRHGPADAPTLAQATGVALAEVCGALDALQKQGRVRLSADGQAEAVLGRVKSRTTLPAQLWNALQATDRLYSEKEIAVLRAAMPFLQFARARLAEFADHGVGHALRVKSFASQLGYVVGLTPAERRLLRMAALFHDVGNAVDRERHSIISQETVARLTTNGELPFSPQEAEVVGLLCRWHNCPYDPDRGDDLGGEVIRTGLLASILRVADAMDIDHRRSDYTHRLAHVLRLFYPHKLPYWTSLEEILGVRIVCTPAVTLQVFTQGRLQDNMQIAMLREDLQSTPLAWAIREIAVGTGGSDDFSGRAQAREPRNRPALLVFPFDPHSLVMAALSRQHLAAAGYDVELLCYPDTAGGPQWLWGQTLPAIEPGHYDRLVVIGDRPDPGVTPQLLETVGRWPRGGGGPAQSAQAAGAAVSLLNRHEANWSRLPALLQQGVAVILGGDWAYFWGDAASRADLAWGRIAALCTRDSTQSTVGLTAAEQAVTQGLLKVVYDAASQPAGDTDSWVSLAQPILERIQADDRAYFAAQAGGFAATYATTSAPGRREGRVLRFEEVPGQLRPACYWALEAAIERHGRVLERYVSFNVPYAVATWTEDDMVQMLAINHWREEEAPPIRLLYPADVGPPPAGNESTIQVRLPVRQAARVVRALLDACNREGG